MIVVISCKKNEPLNKANNADYSATPVLPETPYEYANSSNNNLATLGRVLFYDKSLSLNNSVSCASCHQQSKAFCDNLQFSPGLENNKTVRNAPSIFSKTGRMFWDGRAQGLQNLILRPIQNHIEMRFDNLEALAQKIAKINYYPQLFHNAFGNYDIDSSKIKNALVEFVRNFNFSNNKFSKSLNNAANLNASETQGKLVFFGKGKCFNCHHVEPNNPNMGGYGFTDMDFNIGLDESYTDNGLGNITKNTEDNGKFMVPVLLNVEFTAPYMHDGRFKTLEEVVEHYNSGIKNHPNLDFVLRNTSMFDGLSDQQILQQFDANHNGQLDPSEIPPLEPVKLNLNESEKKSLVDFLKTLSDPTIFTEAKFKNPFTK